MLGIWDVASTDVTLLQGFGKPCGGGGAGARPGCGDDNVVCNWWPGHPSRADRRTGRGGLIRHVTSDTRSLITPGIAHIGHMSHPTPAHLQTLDITQGAMCVMYVLAPKKASNGFKEFKDKGNMSWEPSHLPPFPDVFWICAVCWFQCQTPLLCPISGGIL